MAKRKSKPDTREITPTDGPSDGVSTDDPTSFDPSTFDAPTRTDAVALPPMTAEAAGHSPHSAAMSVDADGRVTYTVPADATPEPRSAPNPEGDADAARPLPNPFGVRADHEAGVGLLEDRRFRQMQIRFREKPSDEVRRVIREAGYQWRSQDQAWTKQIDPDAAWRTRAEATALFDRVAGMVRDEMGLGREVG